MIKRALASLTACVIIAGITLGSDIALGSENVPGATACPRVGFVVVEPQASKDTRPLRVSGSQTIYVRQVPITTTSDITDIKLVEDDDDANLLIKFNTAGTQRLHDATTNHSGRRIAFLFNDEVLLNVIWEGRFGLDGGEAQVSIRHGLKQAREVIEALRGCTVGVPAGESHSTRRS